MDLPPHGEELAYVAMAAVVLLWWFMGSARSYGWRPWKWPWGVWFRRR